MDAAIVGLIDELRQSGVVAPTDMRDVEAAIQDFYDNPQREDAAAHLEALARIARSGLSVRDKLRDMCDLGRRGPSFMTLN